MVNKYSTSADVTGDLSPINLSTRTLSFLSFLLLWQLQYISGDINRRLNTKQEGESCFISSSPAAKLILPDTSYNRDWILGKESTKFCDYINTRTSFTTVFIFSKSKKAGSLLPFSELILLSNSCLLVQ
jgi:hypothetical protein